MQLIRVLSLCLLAILHGMLLPIRAQVAPETFLLPDAQAAEAYRVSIEQVLNESYGLKLETGRRRSSFRWALSDGEMPPGLSMRPTGTIAGVPRAPREEPYHFRIRVIDISVAGPDPLILDFSLKVNAPRIRLSRINAPRLVPASSASVAASEADATSELGHRPSPSASTLVNPTAFDFTGRPTTPAHAADPGLPSSLPTRRLVFQQGTYAPDLDHRWMGSIAMDKLGDIVLGYNVSGSVSPSIRLTSRFPTDAPGQLGKEVIIQKGTGWQGTSTDALSRWGNYSGMTIDPTDDCTFWYTAEYGKENGTFNWHTSIASFQLNKCK